MKKLLLYMFVFGTLSCTKIKRNIPTDISIYQVKWSYDHSVNGTKNSHDNVRGSFRKNNNSTYTLVINNSSEVIEFMGGAVAPNDEKSYFVYNIVSHDPEKKINESRPRPGIAYIYFNDRNIPTRMSIDYDYSYGSYGRQIKIKENFTYYFE